MKNIVLNRWQQVSLVFGLFVGFLFFSSFQMQNDAEDEWTFLSEQSGIKAYVMLNTCENASLYVFKFENNTEQSVSFTYTMTAVDNPTFPPVTKKLTLQANESKVGSCADIWELALPNNANAKGLLNEQVSIELTTNR